MRLLDMSFTNAKLKNLIRQTRPEIDAHDDVKWFELSVNHPIVWVFNVKEHHNLKEAHLRWSCLT